jgi:PAS domain S-box-containing protein
MKKPLHRLPAQEILVFAFLLFSVPFGFVVHRLAAEIDASMAFSSKERLGVEYNQQLRQLLETVIAHQSLIAANTDEIQQSAIATKQAEIEQAIQQVNQVEARLGQTLKTTADWQMVQVLWQQLQRTAITNTPNRNQQLSTELTQRIIALMAHVGDTSNLILDPDLDSYYMMDATVNHLPAMLGKSAQVRDFNPSRVRVRKLDANPSNTERSLNGVSQNSLTLDEKVFLIGLRNSIQTSMKSIQRGVSVAVGYNSKVQPRVQPSFNQAKNDHQQFVSLVYQASTNPDGVSPVATNVAANQAIASQFAFYDAASQMLDQLVAIRVNGYAQRKQSVYWFGLFVLLLVTGVFSAFSYNLRQRKRADQRLNLQYTTTRALAESLTLNDAAPALLQSLGMAMGWHWGELWQFNPETQRMQLVAVWGDRTTEDAAGLADHHAASLTQQLIGKVWNHHQPLWVVDSSHDPNSAPSLSANTAGFQSAVACPIDCHDQKLGVIAFFSRDRQPLDQDLLQTLHTIANQIGQFIQRHATEAALQTAEENFRTIVEHAVDGIFQTTPEGQYLNANPALAKIYGYTSPQHLIEELSGHIHSIYVEPHRRTEFVQLIEQYGSVVDFESQIRRRDGDLIWISENARAVRDEAGNLRYYEGSVKDISDRKQAADDLFKAKELAESANRAKSQFLANMSHELRTPLNAIIGYSEMLQEDAVDFGCEDVVPDLEKIRSAGKHLLSLINDILDISKIEAGKMSLYLETFDIPQLLSEVKATIQPLVAKNNNTLVVHCDPALGCMRADLTKVRQNLLNMLSNASKFTEAGTVTLAVEVAEASSMVHFQVSDTGIGMTASQLTRLFQPFTQADNSTTRKYGGTGLGLAITQRFCQMMGGDITVTSTLGQGTTFTMSLPLSVADSAEDGPQPLPSALANPTEEDIETALPTPNAATILVIDDDPSVRDLLVRQLGKAGFRVETASNGQEGLHLARKLLPNAITLDVMMPVMGGWSVLSELKADPVLADIPVVMLTIVDDQNQGFALGASDYLTKPIDHKRLSKVLNHYRPKASDRARHAASDPGSGHTSGHVLLAEDDDATRLMLQRLLNKAGWSVAAAENGLVALNYLDQQKPDLILLDLMMPTMDGFQFISELRSRPDCSQIPVVVVTAMDLTAAEQQELNGRVEQVLQKRTNNRDALLQEVSTAVCDIIHQQNYSLLAVDR